MDWTLVVPVKRLELAKTRLGVPAHHGLALAFAQDTVAAAVATAGVARVVVVSDDTDVRSAVARLGVVLRPDVPHGGLNATISTGVAWAGGGPVAVLPSDLPALTPDELAEALAASAEHSRAFVPDASGTGTTLLTATSGTLRPRYGPESAGQHARDGCVTLAGDWPGLRRDVDTFEDLLAARRLGIGPETEAVLAMTPLLCPTSP